MAERKVWAFDGDVHIGPDCINLLGGGVGDDDLTEAITRLVCGQHYTDEDRVAHLRIRVEVVE